MRILHIASENISGVPLTLVRAHQRQGHYSRLITFFKSPRKHGDDIVLGLPLSNTGGLKPIKKTLKVGTYKTGGKPEKLKVWEPSPLERIILPVRDMVWMWKIKPYLDFIMGFDVYFLDGGTGILRSGKIVRELKNMGRHIRIIYFGSDLRTRGIFPHIEELAEKIYTVELDHTLLHKGVEYIFFPFDVWRFNTRKEEDDVVTICHAPTNRYLKGTDYLIKAYNEIKDEYPVELLIMENMPHHEVLRLKYERCDILVDQLTDLGGFGYGINSLEALSMGIPCVTYLNPFYENFIPDHPFINANPDNLRDVLVKLINEPELRRERGLYGRIWVEKYHDATKVSQKILEGL